MRENGFSRVNGGPLFRLLSRFGLIKSDVHDAISVTVAASIPLLPLLLTVYPFDELLQKMLQIFV